MEKIITKLLVGHNLILFNLRIIQNFIRTVEVMKYIQVNESESLIHDQFTFGKSA